MVQDNLRRLLRTMLLANSLDKIALRIHQIKINAMIDQVILALLHTLGGREIDPVFLAHVFDLLPCAREADEARMEFRQVGSEHGGSVAGGIAGYEDREERRRRDFDGWRGADEVDHLGHFVEFFGTDIWTVGEAEIYLNTPPKK